MLSSAVQNKLLEMFPVFATLPRDAWERVITDSRTLKFDAGSVLFEDGVPCLAFPLVLEGTARIIETGDNGRELLLYRLHPGDMCVVSTTCLFGQTAYNASGVANSDLTVAALPAALFSSLVAQHEPFRTFVFRLFSERISDLMQLVEAVAFQRLDQRLAALLLGRGDTLIVTHQKLADDLGSVREMVSRLLRRFEDQGLIALHRERIDILNADALQRTAASSPVS